MFEFFDLFVHDSFVFVFTLMVLGFLGVAGYALYQDGK